MEMLKVKNPPLLTVWRDALLPELVSGELKSQAEERMTDRTLILFPDTNLFIQCKPLKEIDWSEWSEFSEVQLLVCRPVTREIDDQKNRGNTRVAQRARSTYRLFGPVAEGRQEFLTIRDSAPAVKLFLEAVSRTTSGLDDILDYTKTDDQIVGCLHRYRHDNPEVDARFVTYYRGQILAASALGLPFEVIRETWLLQPEHSELEKENARLKERVSQLESAEPRFKIELVDEIGVAVERLTIEHCIYEPLSSDEVEALMNAIVDRYPMATKFGPIESDEDDKNMTAGEWLDRRSAIGPPKDEEIAKYRDREYPAWVRRCRKMLSDLHEELQREAGHPTFTFAVTNEGTRPGNDSLVAIEAKGNFKICPPPYRGEFDEDTEEELALPRPPRPPRGPQAPNAFDAVLGMGRIAERMNLLRGTANPFNLESLYLPPPIGPHDRRRDPNGFYYKPGRPSEPEESFELECEQWRHSTGQEHFLGEIFFDTEPGEIRGALRCAVHAENLSAPVRAQFPVTIVVRKVRSYERARNLVEKLIGRRI